MVPAAVGVLMEEDSSSSPSRQRKRQRHRLASTGDFELRHWRPGGKRTGTGMRGRWVPPEIEIPGGEAGAYTSLRDIMSSPEYAAGSPAAGGDVDTIRHPLVKHAAHAYLQLTPSSTSREDRWGRRQRSGTLCRLLVSCIGFVGAFFGR